MLLISFVSALVLIESREIFNGLLSQPFVISLLLVFLGYDPKFVLLTATLIHLIYLNISPSGTSLYPEYPFGFFIVISMSKYFHLNFFSFLSSVVLIILISRMTALFLKYKRQIFEKYREKILFYHHFPNIGIALFSSFILLFAYSLSIVLLIKLLYLGINNAAFAEINDISFAYNLVIILCIGFSIHYAYKNYKIRV